MDEKEEGSSELPSAIYGFSSDRVDVIVTKKGEERLKQMAVRSNLSNSVVGLTLSTLPVQILDSLDDIPACSDWEQNQAFYVKQMMRSTTSNKFLDLIHRSFELGESTVYIGVSNKKYLEDGRQSTNTCPSKLCLYYCVELPAFEKLHSSFQIVRDGIGDELADVTISLRNGCEVPFERDNSEDIYLTEGLRDLNWQFRQPYCYRIKCVPPLLKCKIAAENYEVFDVVKMIHDHYEVFDLKDEPLADIVIMSLSAAQYRLSDTDITPWDLQRLLGPVSGELDIEDEGPFERAVKYLQQAARTWSNK